MFNLDRTVTIKEKKNRRERKGGPSREGELKVGGNATLHSV